MRVLPDRLQGAAAAAAVPTRTANALERLLAIHPDLDEQLSSDAALGALAAVTSASRSLTRVLESDPAALTVLDDLDRRVPERRRRRVRTCWHGSTGSCCASPPAT